MLVFYITLVYIHDGLFYRIIFRNQALHFSESAFMWTLIIYAVVPLLLLIASPPMVILLLLVVVLWHFELAVGQLILREVAGQLLQSVDGPKGKFWHFDPSAVFCFRVYHHDYQVQVIFFEAGGDAWAGGGCPSGLHSIETFTQQRVAALPYEFFGLIVLVAPNTLIPDLAANVAHDRVLHGNARELADIRCRRSVIRVAEPVGVGEVS